MMLKTTPRAPAAIFLKGPKILAGRLNFLENKILTYKLSGEVDEGYE
jgi:hypothetical protein